LERLLATKPELPVLMITAYATAKQAVEVIKAGAIDYLSKPFEPEELIHQVTGCADATSSFRENVRLRRQASPTFDVDQIIGDSPSMIELRGLIKTVAASNATVLILGESGVGKGVWWPARIHALSSRRDAAYVRINCAAIPENLLKANFLAMRRGLHGRAPAKTGPGRGSRWSTVFLDEIGDMSRPLQAKLLPIPRRVVHPRGGNEELRVDVPLIAAPTGTSSRPSVRTSFARTFHRLNVVQLCPPPLASAGETCLTLAHLFLADVHCNDDRSSGELHRGAGKLLAHHWPGQCARIAERLWNAR